MHTIYGWHTKQYLFKTLADTEADEEEIDAYLYDRSAGAIVSNTWFTYDTTSVDGWIFVNFIQPPNSDAGAYKLVI